jgi:hypothetical protein
MGITHGFDTELEPVSPLVTDAPITMKLAFTPHIKYRWCKDVKITVKTLDYDNTLSEKSWDAELDENQHYSTTFQVSIPDNDTCAVHVTLECQRLRETFKLFFVTTGDAVVREGGDPRGHFGVPPVSSHRPNKIDEDTLTEKQLQTEYEVLLDLSDTNHREFAEKILGAMTGSGKYKSCNACYILNVSLENILNWPKKGLKANLLLHRRGAGTMEFTRTAHLNIDSILRRRMMKSTPTLSRKNNYSRNMM